MGTESVLGMLERARRPLAPFLRSRLVGGLTSPRSIDDYLELVDPAWSVHGVRARVVALQEEAGDAVSLLLRPSEAWRDFRSGQHVRLSVRAAGVRVTRSFSLSSAPEDGLPLRVTVKVTPSGAFSRWLRTEARVGSIVGLTQAKGSFVLPTPVPPALLFISGGSGITPVLSMARHLAATNYTGRLDWLHYARRDVILGSEQASLAARCGQLHLEGRTRFTRERLEELVPDWTEATAFLCGPPSLTEAVVGVWTAAGLAERLRMEHFAERGAPLANRPDERSRHRLVFARSGRVIEGRSGASLLEQAESAGLEPPYGCRRGVCRTCTCRKLSGTVRNDHTGAISSEPNEDIQLCINTPQSDVSLDL